MLPCTCPFTHRLLYVSAAVSCGDANGHAYSKIRHCKCRVAYHLCGPLLTMVHLLPTGLASSSSATAERIPWLSQCVLIIRFRIRHVQRIPEDTCTKLFPNDTLQGPSPLSSLDSRESLEISAGPVHPGALHSPRSAPAPRRTNDVLPCRGPLLTLCAFQAIHVLPKRSSRLLHTLSEVSY